MIVVPGAVNNKNKASSSYSGIHEGYSNNYAADSGIVNFMNGFSDVMSGIANQFSSALSNLNFNGYVNNNEFNAEQAQLNRDFQQASAREAMEFSAEQSQINRDFQQASAREQMAFQERMSNTSYQRAVEDLRKAGINPILAYTQGGASTPGGSSASGSSASGISSGGSAASGSGSFAPTSKTKEVISLIVSASTALGEMMASDKLQSFARGVENNYIGLINDMRSMIKDYRRLF